jgi:ketosteroid isomerase-like protein
MTPQEAKNCELTSQAIGHFARNELEENLALLTADCSYSIGGNGATGAVPFHGTFKGRAAIRKFFAEREKHVIRVKCARHGEMVPFKNKVIVFGRLTDNFRGSRKKAYESDFVQVWTIDEAQNKISAMKIYLDTAAVLVSWLHGYRPAAGQ